MIRIEDMSGLLDSLLYFIKIALTSFVRKFLTYSGLAQNKSLSLMDSILPYIPVVETRISVGNRTGTQTCNGANVSFPIRVDGSIFMATVNSSSEAWTLLPGSDEIQIHYVGIPGSTYSRYYLYVSCTEDTLVFRIQANVSSSYNMGSYSYTILYFAI